MDINQHKANVEVVRQDYVKLVNLVGKDDPRCESMRIRLEESVKRLEARKYDNVSSMTKLKAKKANIMSFEQQDANVETLYQDFIKMGFLVGWEDPRTTSMRQVWSDAEDRLSERLKEGGE